MCVHISVGPYISIRVALQVFLKKSIDLYHDVEN
jgi:hypothetical protein